MRLLLRRDLVCQQAVELVTEYLEGTLSRSARRRFEAHLAGLPALHRVPGPDAGDHQPHRTAGARGPDSADAGRVLRPVPPVAVRAAVTSAVTPSAPASGSMTTAGS